MSREEAVQLLESSKTAHDWNVNCAEIKRRCGGYPAWWFEAVIGSGLAGRIMMQFGSAPEVKLRGGHGS